MDIFRVYKFPLVLGCIGCIIFSYGIISIFQAPKEEESVVFTAGEEHSPTRSAETIFIDVSGAVVRPGVYKIPADARIQDALLAAGGMMRDADQAYVAKRINLAAKVTDGGKLYVPFQGESITSTTSTTGITGDAGQRLININDASASELESLPGVGEVTAEKIINNRPYGEVGELVSKKILSSSVFEKVKDKVSVY